MSKPSSFEELGVLPLQDHGADGPELDLRFMLVGGRVADVDAQTGEPKYALGESGKGTLGDVHPFRFWPQGERPMGAWSMAFASISLGSSGGSSSAESPASGSAGGAGGQTPGTGQPGTAGAHGGSLAHGHSLGQRPVRNDPFPGSGRVGILGPGGAVRPGRPGGAVTEGDGSSLPVLPLYSSSAGDGSFAPVGHDLPPCWPLFPKGVTGIALAGTDARRQRNVWLPADPRLWAPHAGGPPEMGTIVGDLQPDRTPNSERAARLQSAWQVLLLPKSLDFLSHGAALALNFKASTQDFIGGFGLAIAKGDVSRSQITPTPAAPGQPGNGPVVTPGDRPTSASPGSPGPDGAAGSAGAVGAPGAPSGSGSQPPYNGGSSSDPKHGAEPLGYTWDPGSASWRGPVRGSVNDPFVQGGSFGIMPHGAIVGGNRGGGGSGGAGSGGGGPSVCGEPKAESLKDTGNVAFFLARPSAYGPIHPGHVDDKHHHGVTLDGQPINAGHIHHEAFIYQDRNRDGPLLYSRFDYPFPNRLPGIARTWISWNGRDQHDFAKGQRPGKWWLFSEIPDLFSGPPEEPEDPKPPSGPPTPPPPPPPVVTPPVEPTDPPSGKQPTTPPPTPYPPLPGRPGLPAPTEPSDPPTGTPAPRPCGGGGPPVGPPAPARPNPVGPPAPQTFPHPSAPGWVPWWSPNGGPGAQDGVTPSGHPVYLASALVGPADRRSGQKEATVTRALASGFASMHFRPQSLAPMAFDYRFSTRVDREAMEADDALRPTVARLEAFAAGQKDSAGYAYNVKPRDSRFKGGEAPGGVVFLPPHLDIADIDLDLSVEGQPSDLAYFAFAPGTVIAWGLPKLSDGSMQQGAFRGRRVAASPTNCSLAFETVDGSGTWTTALGLVVDSNGIGVVAGSTAYLKLPIGTTAQRPGAPADGMVRYNSTLAAVEGRVGGAWRQLLHSASAVTGTLVAVTAYISSGSGTHTWNASATSAQVILVGGGGGGGGVAGTTAGQSAVAGGGAAGGLAMHFFATLSGSGASYTVGAKGTGGAGGGNNGNAGSDTTFDDAGTTYTAKGGGGGSFTAESAATGAAAGGTSSAATGSPNLVVGSGNPGMPGIKLGAAVAVGGAGGCSHMGGAGGAGGVNDAAGSNGVGPGAGGGGASSTSASANDFAGGDGVDGLILVFEYA